MDAQHPNGYPAARDGYVLDYISGIEVRATAEEVSSVQIFARQLVEDYGYPFENIRTRPQWLVKKSPSDTSGTYPVDIAVFSSSVHTDDSLQIVVECKKPNRKDGEAQLRDYLNLSQATLGVWFNGAERLFLRKVASGAGWIYESIPNIPRYGERVEDIGKFARKDLRPTHNLRSVFSVIRNHLAANAVGTTRDEELARQMINLVFCKIWDERFTAPEETVSFRAGIDEEASLVKARIEDLFKKVKKKYTGIIDTGDSIDLDAKSVQYVVGELQNYCIIDSERDVVADAFETFIGGALKGGQGQFFTPRNVVRLMARIAAPTRDTLFIDPACGSGGFLVETLRAIWADVDRMGAEMAWPREAVTEEKVAAAMKNIYGIEKDSFLSKVAKAYMAIIGDGKGASFAKIVWRSRATGRTARDKKFALGSSTWCLQTHLLART